MSSSPSLPLPSAPLVGWDVPHCPRQDHGLQCKGVIAHRAGAWERVALLLGDRLETNRRLLDTETRMTAVVDELRLTSLVTSVTGLSAIGAAAILAETGDPNRFASARALVKHAGLAPREKLSGTFKAAQN